MDRNGRLKSWRLYDNEYAPKDDGTTVGVNLTEFNATYSANNMYARMEYGMIDYTDGPIMMME